MKSRSRELHSAAFVRAYFAHIDAQDLQGRSARDLARLAQSHLQFARKRSPGPLVRVFNPTRAEQGYESSHTVVELVCDDMPFLVDSVGLVLAQRGLALHFLVHPIFDVTRRAGRIVQIHERNASISGKRGRGRAESFQHFEVDRIADAAQMRALREQIEDSLRDVRIVCADWPAMRAAARAAADSLLAAKLRADPTELEECRALLAWMESKHFTFMGYREYRLARRGSAYSLHAAPDSGLGILRWEARRPAIAGKISSRDIEQQVRSGSLALVTKANSMSTVHRRGYLDYVGIKQFDARGKLIGERRFLGLWTSAAYAASPFDIPVLRRKVAAVVAHFGLPGDSHDGKALTHILENFPRDELFQASLAELIRSVAGVLGLQERPRVRIFLRRDAFRRFYSCLVFVPRDQYSTQVRQRIERVMRETFAATRIELQVQIAESNLARVYLVARTSPTAETRVNVDALERRIEAAVRSWNDGLRDALLARLDEERALALYARYAHALPAAYAEDFDPQVGASDVEMLESLNVEPSMLPLEIYRRDTRKNDRFFLKFYRQQDAIPISDVVPMLENMGLRVIAERPYELELAPGKRAWIQDLELELRGPAPRRFETLVPVIKNTFTAIWNGQTDNDAFNQLTIGAGLEWREINVLRAYARYLLQSGLPFSHGYIAQVLSINSKAAGLLSSIFHAQFDPGTARATRQSRVTRLNARFRAMLETVTHSDEDRILRGMWNALRATVRTNAFQAPDGQPKDYLSFKIESQKLAELPLPRPLFEIFVFSTRMEGVHLRMGRVARGGIRWSDRREDFRTEILGLMKAQNVKNTVIVPVGAKGGFVVKRLPAGREEAQREVVACYTTLIRGLLDLTDNIVDDEIVPPPLTVRHDADDPYLVVAADKGTASFSDIANSISAEYGFWLGDAFASGGSAGYDHKKMAITARGAWVCVKRHFRELGFDTQSHDFTMAGIGDMAGDVFGNGMLQSKHIRLLAAFNHMHIFIDPNPDAARSFVERRRLFNLPRSSWEDYPAKLISKGGSVFSRASKSLTLSKEAQALLELPSQATPNEVIKAILKMRVDLLWNGGIGTYVKSSAESNAEVGDRSNDALRVDGRMLRCRVIGEGGNLGLTQLGRVEFARLGGKLNTDFIDNSAGVNCSDVEVNIKIVLNGAMQAGQLARAPRNRLLASMTDDVAALVLRNNYLQSQSISSLELRAPERLSEHAYVIRALERTGDLNRSLEYLPSDEEIAERRKAGEGLTRPELATLLSYSKIWLYRSLIQSDVPEDPQLSTELDRYFPPRMLRKFPRRIRGHRLRREIIATAVTNSLINRMGPVFAIRARDDTGAEPAAIARAYTIAREVFAVRELWLQIESLDYIMPPAAQYDAMYETSRLLRHMSYWFLAYRRADLHIERNLAHYGRGIVELMRVLPGALGPADAAHSAAQTEKLRSYGAPEALARRLSSLDALHAGLDIVDVAHGARKPVEFAARLYFDLGERLGLSWLKSQIEQLSVDGHWQSIARGTLRDNLFALQRRLAAAAAGEKAASPRARIDRWMLRHSAEIESLRRVVVDMRTGASPDFATLSVALQQVRLICGE